MTSTRTRSAGAVLAVVAALAVAACSAGPVPPASHGAAIVTPPSTTTPSAPSNTDADNRSVALAAARRALRRLRLPPGSARLAGRPHGLPRDTGYGTWSDGPTAWFSVPLGRGAVSAYEHAKPPLGWFSDGSGESPATSSIEFDPRRQASPARFTGPSLEVVWGDFEGHAVLEAHAEAEARHVRPPQSLVGTAVGRVEVSRVATRTTGTAGPSPVRLTITSAATITRLRRAVNRLYGSPLVVREERCPMAFPPVADTIAFRSGSDVLTFSWPRGGCVEQVTVTHDGKTEPVTLDPGRLSDVVDRVIKAAER